MKLELQVSNYFLLLLKTILEDQIYFSLFLLSQQTFKSEIIIRDTADFDPGKETPPWTSDCPITYTHAEWLSATVF